LKLTGTIKSASGILVTDPLYVDSSDPRYEANVSGSLNVVISISTHKEKITYEGKRLDVSTTDLDMILSRGGLVTLRKRDKALLHPPELEAQAKSIGVDSARLYIGPSGSCSREDALLTGGDGYFGEVVEFTLPGAERTTHHFSGETVSAGWYAAAIRLSFPSDVIAENELLQSLVTRFRIEDIKNIGK